MPSEDVELLRRLLEFELERDVEVTETVDEYGWGRAFLSPTIPLVWDANWILIEQPGMSIDQIVRAADEALGSAGMEHRTIFPLEPSEGVRLAPEFEARGWDVEAGVYMVWRREPDRTSEIEVAERRQIQIEELRRSLISDDLATLGLGDAATTEQLLEWDRRMGAVGGDRWFTAPAGDDPASACRLLTDGTIGQVEDVGTRRDAREQGFARAVTFAAARASRDAGHELTYLGALANDWPRLLYAKLGFDEIGTAYAFRRKPPSRSM
jgi:hypothetical protein